MVRSALTIYPYSLGCKGNAYRGDEALTRSEAYAFHQAQVAQFRAQQLDFLFAGIMPAGSETLGMSQAMAESKLPYIISFMIRKDGRLLDGTGITEAFLILRAQDVGLATGCMNKMVSSLCDNLTGLWKSMIRRSINGKFNMALTIDVKLRSAHVISRCVRETESYYNQITRRESDEKNQN